MTSLVKMSPVVPEDENLKSLRQRQQQRRTTYKFWSNNITRVFGSGELKGIWFTDYKEKNIILFIITKKELFKKHKIQVIDENDFFSATQNHAENECIFAPVTTILSIALALILGNVNVSEWSSLIKIFSCLQTIAKRGKNINSSSRAFQQVIPNYTQKPFILESEDRCIITLIRAVLLTAIYLSIFLSVIFLSFRFIVLFYFVISIISFSPILAVILP